MPFKLCNCDKDKLNEVIDQVKKLSNTVDELRAEINSMKFCTSAINNDKIVKTRGQCREGRKKIGPGTLHKLKKFWENKFIHVLSADTGYRVKKKCQEIFSQSPKSFVPCPAQLSPGKTPIYHHLSSSECIKKEKDSQIYESCPITQFDRTKRAKARSKKSASSSTRKRRKCVSRNSKKNLSASISLISTSSLDQPNHRDKSLKSSRCTYELCNALNSPVRCNTSGTPKNRIGKKKTKGTATSDLMSRRTTEGCRKNPAKFVRRRRSVNFVDRKKNSVAVQTKKSSASSAILTSDSSVCDLQSCKVMHKEPKRDYKTKKTIKNGSSELKKKSRSAQCSPNCLYLKRPKLCPRDVSTNTFADECIKASKKRVSEKRLMSQETQTSLKSDEYIESSYCNEQTRFCSDTKRNCRAEGSLTSLTSQCSRLSVNSFFQGSDELSDELITKLAKREEEEKFEERRKSDDPEKKKETVEQVKVLSSTQAKDKIAERSKKPRSDSEEILKHRRKRTYVVSSDIQKTDEAIQHNFETEQNDFPSHATAWRSYEKNGNISCCRKKLKKPEVICQIEEDRLQRPLNDEYYPKKYKSRYTRNTVCTNRPTNSYFPKFSQWSRNKIKRSRSNNGTVQHQQVCETSSSSQEFSDGSCSLILDSDVCEKSRTNSIKHCTIKNRPTNGIKTCSWQHNNSGKYAVCGSLSGSVRSISSESHNREEA